MAYLFQEEWSKIDAYFNGSSSDQFVVDAYVFFNEAHELITKLLILLKINSQVCISTAMVFFHKYVAKVNIKSEFDKYLIAASCLFISSKVCNKLFPVEEMVKRILNFEIIKNTLLPSSLSKVQLHNYNNHNNNNQLQNEELIFKIKEMIFSFEFDIYNAIGFDLNVELPYRYIINIKDYFISTLKKTELFTFASNFINDSFKIPLCLYYHPMLIATASLYLIKIHLKIDLPDKNGTPWFKLLDKNIEIDVVTHIAKSITLIYKYISKKDVNKSVLFNYNFNDKNESKNDNECNECNEMSIDYDGSCDENNVNNNVNDNTEKMNLNHKQPEHNQIDDSNKNFQEENKEYLVKSNKDINDINYIYLNNSNNFSNSNNDSNSNGINNNYTTNNGVTDNKHNTINAINTINTINTINNTIKISLPNKEANLINKKSFVNNSHNSHNNGSKFDCQNHQVIHSSIIITDDISH